MNIKKGLQSAYLKVRTWKARIQSKTKNKMNQTTIEDKQRKPFALWEKAMIGLIGGTILMAILSPFVSASNTSQLADPLGLVQVTGLTEQQKEEIKIRKEEKAQLEIELADYETQIAQLTQNLEMTGARIQELDLEMAQIKAGKTVTGTGSFQ